MPARREPNERAQPDLTPDDWEVAVQWRPLAYRAIRDFVAKITKRSVSFRGKIGTPSFAWQVDGGAAFGLDPVSLCQDLEYRAVEAVAHAAHVFADTGTEDHLSEAYLRKAVLRALQDEFDRWVLTSSAPSQVNYGSTVAPLFGEDEAEPSYLESFDQDEPDDGLSDEERARLQIALGALSSKEAIALRLLADGQPYEEIARNLGYKHVQSVYKLIDTAREKGQRAYERTQDA